MGAKGKILAVLAAVLLLVPGCSGRDEAVDVAIVLKTTVDTAEFWQEAMDGAQSAAQELGVRLTVTGAEAETEVDEQIAILEDAIETLPDVIILVASDYERLVPATNAAVAAGIPVVTMDSDVHTDARSTYVASDNYAIGQALGEALLEVLDRGQVAILTHSSLSSSGVSRAQGAEDALAACPDLEVLGVYDCGNDRDTAADITRELVETYPDLRGFICTNEVGNLAVAETLTDMGLGGTLAVVGCDNAQQQIQYLEQGVIQAIIIQRPFNMGYLAVEQAVRVHNNQMVPDFTEIACVTITQDNMYNSENQKLLFPF